MAGSPQHVTLTAATVAALSFDDDFNRFEVLNVDGAAAIYFRFDGEDPDVAETGSHVLPAAIGSVEIQVAPESSVVKLISAGTPKVSVRGI
jgi:hypothetical protein